MSAAQDFFDPPRRESSGQLACGSPSHILAPSLLAGNHARLADSAQLIRDHGLTWAHLDIMDGHFVPNLTFGPQTLRALRDEVDLFYDVHLMLDEPHRYCDAFIEAGANLVTIHVEPDYPVAETLAHIRSRGIRCGLACNPGTPVESVYPFLPQVDLVLAMTVQPGYGGQAFQSEVLPKIAALAAQRNHLGLRFRIEVDGGVDTRSGPACRQAGADTLVAGTAFFKAPDKAAFLRTMTNGIDDRP